MINLAASPLAALGNALAGRYRRICRSASSTFVTSIVDAADLPLAAHASGELATVNSSRRAPPIPAEGDVQLRGDPADAYDREVNALRRRDAKQHVWKFYDRGNARHQDYVQVGLRCGVGCRVTAAGFHWSNARIHRDRGHCAQQEHAEDENER